MKRIISIAAVLAVQAISAWAAEPLIGVWKLDSQEINGNKSNVEPMTLKISEASGAYTFAFSVPVNNVYFVSMTYTVKLDGSSGDVKNSNGEKVGAAQVTAVSPSHYKLVLKGPNRPDSSGKLTVSPDGKTLTSETDTMQGARSIHSVQVFTRN